MAKSASFKNPAWAGADEVSVTGAAGQSVSLKPDESGSVTTTDPGVIAALRSDPSTTEVVEAPAKTATKKES